MSFLVNGGYLPLGGAVTDQNEALVDSLLQKGVENLDEVDFYDRTALQYAARLGNCSIGRKLLKAGCNVDTVDSCGVTALHIAACKGHDQFVKILLDKGCCSDPSSSDGIRPIHCAAGNGHTTTVRMLLDTGVEVNAIGPGSRTPIYMAAECGHLGIVEALGNAHAKLNIASDYGCDTNILTKNFESPIHIAVRMGHVEVLKTLIQHGCDVNLCESVGNVTPLHVAVNTHHDITLFSQLFQQLLKGGCILNWRAFSTLETPLYRALGLERDDIAALLLCHGADPNLASPFDITALQKSCQRGKVKLTEMLLNCGIQWKREGWLKDFWELQGEVTQYSAINSLVCQWRCEPVPLQKLCRITIRQELIENVKAKVQQLPIPEKMQNFLLLCDLM